MIQIQRIAFILILSVVLSGCSEVDLKLNHPNLISVSPDGRNLIILDAGNKRVLITDTEFNLEKSIDYPLLQNPWGLDVSQDKVIAVTNNRFSKACHTQEDKKKYALAEVVFYDFQGGRINSFTWTGGRGPVEYPAGILYLGKDRICVSDSRLDRIFLLDQNGHEVSNFSSPGKEPGNIYFASDIDLLPSGELLVVDAYNSRLQVFDAEGKFKRVIAEKGKSPGQVMFPQYAAVAKDGTIYCTEMYTMRISMFNPDFSFKKCIEMKSLVPETKIFQLFGIEICGVTGKIYVVDSINSCIYQLNDKHELENTLTAVKEKKVKHD